MIVEMAEREGFEPSRPCSLLAFQASALDLAMRPLQISLSHWNKKYIRRDVNVNEEIWPG